MDDNYVEYRGRYECKGRCTMSVIVLMSFSQFVFFFFNEIGSLRRRRFQIVFIHVNTGTRGCFTNSLLKVLYRSFLRIQKFNSI